MRCNVSPYLPPTIDAPLTGIMRTGVGEREWLYRTSFELEVESREHSHFELLFEGLDTVCDVYLVSASRRIPMVAPYGLSNPPIRTERGAYISSRQHVPRVLGKKPSPS